MSSYRVRAIPPLLIRAVTNNKSGLCQTTFTRCHTSTARPRQASTFRLALLGAGLGAATGTAYSLYNSFYEKSASDHMIHEKKPPAVLSALPNVKITKKVFNPKDTTGLDLVLFQFQTCPFCCKVRAALDFLGLSYSVVEVDAVLRQDLKWSEYKKVPMLLAKRSDGKYVQLTDSSTIVSILASFMNDATQDIGELAKFYPSISFFDDSGKKKEDVMNKYFLMFQDNLPKGLNKEKMEEERKWRTWADSHLVHLISPNVYRTRAEAFQTFEWFSDAGEWNVYFPKWERDMMVYVGAMAMWLIAKRLKKRHNLSDDVRSHMYDALDKWTGALEKNNTRFLGGKYPNLADLSVFGVLSSMEGCDAFKDCLQNTKIGDWFYGVKDIISKNKGHIVKDNFVTQNAQTNIA